MDPLSLTFAALADPTRRAILDRLMKGEASVTELAKPFDMSLPAVSKHLKVLERAGLISRGRDAQRSGVEAAGTPLRVAAASTPDLCARWPTGRSTTANSGKRVSIDSTNTCRRHEYPSNATVPSWRWT